MKFFGFEVSHLSSYRNIVFDFDGTLVDSIPAKNEAFRMALSSVLPLTDEIIDYLIATTHLTRIERLKGVMMIATETSPKCFEHAKSAVEEAMVDVYDAVQRSKQLIRFIQSAKIKKKIYIVSAAPGPDLDLWVSKNSLGGAFKQVIGAPHDKYEALNGIVRRAAEQGENDIIYVGDTAYDKELAIRNNIDFMWSEFSTIEGVEDVCRT